MFDSFLCLCKQKVKFCSTVGIKSTAAELPTPFASLFPFIPQFVSFASCVFLQPLTPARRHVIRPAAKWSGASHNLVEVVGHSSATSGVSTGDPGSAPSTSRDAKANASAVRPAIRKAVQFSSSEHTQPQHDSSSQTQSQPKVNTHSQQQDGTSAHTQVELNAVSSIQTPSTSTNATTSIAPLQELVQPQPSTSGLVQPKTGSSAHVTVAVQARTSTSATHHSSCAVASSSTKTQEKANTSISTHSRDNPQASTSTAQSHTRTQSQPGTSTQLHSSGTTILKPTLIQVKEMKLVVLPQQPSIQASALITQPQLQLRHPNVLQPVLVNRMQGNLIQIEPQPLAQAPAQPPAQALDQPLAQAPQPPQVIPVIPPAVLIAAAPERLGPPEAGHRIILGSQAPGEAVHNPPPQADAASVAPPARSLNIRVPVNSNPPAPPVPHNGIEAHLILAPAPNPERVNPAPGLVAVPPVPEDIPRIEDARPGPSAPRERVEQQPLVRTLITGVVSIKRTRC